MLVIGEQSQFSARICRSENLLEADAGTLSVGLSIDKETHNG